MKHLQLLTVFLMLSALSYGQQFNQSTNPVINPINNPIDSNEPGSQFNGQEKFRFQAGLITQLDSIIDGSTVANDLFNFNNRWFSIGRLNTGTQEVYGLRFQLPQKALTFGYQDVNDTNPRIQWIGTGQDLGNLEFRVADDFMSTNSDLVATMRNDGGTVFAEQNLSSFTDAKVGINNSSFAKALNIINESGSIGVDVFQNNTNIINTCYNATIPEGIKGQRNIGYDVSVNANSSENIGYRARVEGQANFRFGFQSSSVGEGITNFGISGSASGADNNYGIFGRVSNTSGVSNNPGDFAGFFDGNITTTAGFFAPSDQKLKEGVNQLEFALEDLMKLQPKTYNYISSKKINLAEGKQFGFIAQELEEVFPELIKEISKPVFNEEEEVKEYLEYKSVNYLGLIAVLTGAIQELAEEVDRLKETNESYVVFSDRLEAEEMERLRKLAYQLE
ncbi:tail fiber domain-containing protein [Psychroflexus maritimus]|uniref:Tail fiber domain-containing protein n=1 Tax=Psychroflexus maritimus TaxID=2714865 RepID=A0A967DXG8_9FLAO|nr:tail fiber domain-containing protein [Psychroflexus maritimus]NGZ88640.1 tail fiber domain-containing protein [Psychroflexus maritimus]